MNTPIVFYQKNLKFNAEFIKLLKTQCENDSSLEALDVTIQISGGSHVEGEYIIPAQVLLSFIKEKTVLACWRNYGYWTQSKVPAKLNPYFKRF
jgi:hypothetical protein